MLGWKLNHVSKRGALCQLPISLVMISFRFTLPANGIYVTYNCFSEEWKWPQQFRLISSPATFSILQRRQFSIMKSQISGKSTVCSTTCLQGLNIKCPHYWACVREPHSLMDFHTKELDWLTFSLPWCNHECNNFTHGCSFVHVTHITLLGQPRMAGLSRRCFSKTVSDICRKLLTV